jgi:hypothetical protein
VCVSVFKVKGSLTFSIAVIGMAVASRSCPYTSDR